MLLGWRRDHGGGTVDLFDVPSVGHSRMLSPLFAASLNPLFCLVGLIQLLGLLTAGGTRFTEGTRYERLGQWICLAALGVVGTVCGVTLPLGPGIATTSVVTLTLMTMIAIVDLPASRRV